MPVNNILVPTDFSAGRKRRCGMHTTSPSGSGATLHVMHVLENPFAPGAFMEMYALPSPDYFLDLEHQAKDASRRVAAWPTSKHHAYRSVMTTRMGVPCDRDPATGRRKSRGST